MTKDLIVFVCLLALAAIQFVIAYQDISASQMFVRMLSVAIIEAALALLFFMHLAENRGLMWFVMIFTVLSCSRCNTDGPTASALSMAYHGRSESRDEALENNPDDALRWWD